MGIENRDPLNNPQEEPYSGLETGAGKKSENPRIGLEYKNYHNGDLVTVVRSDGKEEGDWTFSHQNMETGDIIVTKTIDGKKKMKEISPDNFERMQGK